MKKESEVRAEFSIFFSQRRDELTRNGRVFNKAEEWEEFVSWLITINEAPPEAQHWKCPAYPGVEIKRSEMRKKKLTFKR